MIAGHGRVLAARKLGMTEVPCIELAHLSPMQRLAYILADNQLALNAGWDEEKLRCELGELRLGGFDLSLTGFGELEIKALLADKTEGHTDPDDVPPAPEHPASQAGELWLLGSHRLLCGDSTVATDVERVRATGKVINDDRADWREAWSLFPGDVAYVWHGGVHAGEVQTSLEACRFTVRSQIIWAKSQLVISRGHYHAQHEPCFYAVRDGATGHWSGDRKQTTLWQIDKPRISETGHGTQKPVECSASRAADSFRTFGPAQRLLQRPSLSRASGTPSLPHVD